ncbi:MAG: cysteine hydrolase [Spirochaetes bacterium]|nr:cysteine hydrolase [Spirochaetota bacterium]MBN2770480.1 cysteine hydrolase [Spirochaetota bacterium]
MKTALIIVDMQKYYLEESASFFSYYEHLYPGSMDYIKDRARKTVIPNIQKLIEYFRNTNHPVYFLRLCGCKNDRSDLHRFFKKEHDNACKNGYKDLYPLCDQKDAEIIDQLKPHKNDRIICKTTFSPFTLTDIEDTLRKDDITTLVFTGLATSQCVETTARDASDRNFDIIHIKDAQADYNEDNHQISLFNSRSVCGGWVYDTDEYYSDRDKILHAIEINDRSSATKYK